MSIVAMSDDQLRAAGRKCGQWHPRVGSPVLLLVCVLAVLRLVEMEEKTGFNGWRRWPLFRQGFEEEVARQRAKA